MPAEPPRRGSGPRIPQQPPVDATTRQPKATPPAGTDLSIDARPTAPRRATPSIVDELLEEPTRMADPQPRRAAAQPTETVPYSKAKFANPNDPLLKTHLNEPRPASVTARRLPAVTDIPAMTLRDMPAPVIERERLLTPGPPAPAADPPERAPAPAPYAPSAPTVQSMATVMSAPAPDLSQPAPDAQKTKVWVATHKLPPDPDERLILLREPDSARAASYRVLRHRLAEQHDARVIVVSSPEAGEGKTTCAVNLALALGECGRARVLLVEANLRAPTLAALFGFLPPECFAQQLMRHRERPQDPWSVVEVGSPFLHVAAVKPIQGDERPLLDGVAFGIALDMLRRAGYDYIVLDTPPVLGSADVNLVEDFADGVLLTAWSRRTSSRKLKRAIDQLQPGKILGVTLLDA